MWAGGEREANQRILSLGLAPRPLVIPRRPRSVQAGNVEASASEMAADGSIDLTNTGVGAARVVGYSLIGQSPDNPDEGSLGGQNPVTSFRRLTE